MDERNHGTCPQRFLPFGRGRSSAHPGKDPAVYDETSYTVSIRGVADWTYRGTYMEVRHGVRPDEADEALTDPARLVLDPDPASKSGKSVRTIGWAGSAGRLLTIITFTTEAGVTYGGNGWKSSARDRRKYNDWETG